MEIRGDKYRYIVDTFKIQMPKAKVQTKFRCQSANASDEERGDGKLEMRWTLLEIHGD
jgi:hypothetical protein